VFELPFNSTSKTYASSIKTLYSFCRHETGDGQGCTDGGMPRVGLIADVSGNLYGTTEEGGSSEDGTLFELRFNPAAKTYANEDQVLHNFCSLSDCTDGATPEASLFVDPSGNLFGVTEEGGSSTEEAGTLFELPYDSATHKYASAIRVLYNFCSVGGSDCTDGSSPVGGVIMDPTGNLYGTTGERGSGAGTVFKLSFDHGTQKYAKMVQTLYSFCSQGGTNCTDGDGPGSLIMDESGNLYGTTYSGGTHYSGTVFELPFNFESKEYASTVTILYNFCSKGGSSCVDGSYPQGSLIQDEFSGILYGTTESGGANGEGTIFQLTTDFQGHFD
jgi:uncharacterized repeat protein (TIGR03803 family)